MKKAYIYPISSRFHGKTHNPYLENFMDSLENNFVFVNRHSPSKMGVLDIYRYFFSIQYIFFHWPEDMVERKFGFLQTAGFFILIPLCRLKGIKLVYIVHNKLSHARRYLSLKRMIAKSLARQSKTLTHSREGITFIEKISGKKTNVLYFPHPVEPVNYLETEKDIDILIWGNIAPYKGIDEFLKKYHNELALKKWKLTIAGRVSNNTYLAEIQALLTEDMEIINAFLDEKQLSQLICRSKIVLFPYHPDSVLSSGAFAKTLAYPVHILGPDCGAFADFKHLNNVSTFRDRKEILPQAEQILQNGDLYENTSSTELSKIMEDCSWSSFAEKLMKNL